MSYQPATHGAPPRINLPPIAGDPSAPPGYSSAPGYPPATGYPPQNTGYPPVGYPQPVRGQPQPGICYPPPGDMPEGNWMPIPTGIPICPHGLEYLTMIDQLLVHQKLKMLEVLSSETKYKYTIKNSLGQKVYAAEEDTDCCTRFCWGPIRPFDMIIKDNAGNEVIHFSRDLRCDSCFCPCFLQRLEVMSPPGTLIGTVEQEWAIFIPRFKLKDASGTTILRIEGPFWTTCSCWSDVEFQVLSPNGVKVGKICKQWPGLMREGFTNADHFGITFPRDLDVKAKAIVLGALFLIDYMYFETTGTKLSKYQYHPKYQIQNNYVD